MRTGRFDPPRQNPTGRYVPQGRERQSERPPKKPPPAPRSSAFDFIIDRTITILRDGLPREISMEEALQHRTYQEAIGGKRLAQRQVMKWIRRREAWLTKQDERSAPPTIIETKISPDPKNANAALLLLGVVSEEIVDPHSDPPLIHLKLATWAVQAAFSRRRGNIPFESADIASIRRCTRDPDSLVWPRGGQQG